MTVGPDFAVWIPRFTPGGGYGRGSKIDRWLTDLLTQSDPAFEATHVYSSRRCLFGFDVGS